ncbi:aldehyde dehydrogenase family 3 member B1 [Huso huso]|uniref:Aldehyde dehydrogenase family 3 member B1 n=1 Tax=Huso huso TaxID=61971 RepID=A0ABR0Y7I9_HUSHU
MRFFTVLYATSRSVRVKNEVGRKVPKFGFCLLVCTSRGNDVGLRSDCPKDAGTLLHGVCPAEFRISQLNSLCVFRMRECCTDVEALRETCASQNLISMISLCPCLISNHLASWMKPEHVEKSLVMKFDECFIRKEPLGVVLIIGAWNYPVQLVLVPLIGAIAAGNCAVVKPSELSDSTSSLLTELLPKYLDQSCFSVVCGGAKETTELLEERFDHIFYTGGVSVARSVMRAASCHLTPVTLELGGKSPALVEGSCDVTATARRLVWARFFNAGQSCVAPDYVLCSPETRRLLLPALRDCITQLYGTEPRESRDFGRIINQRHFERIRDLLSNSQGRVEIGGETEEGERYIAPTVLVDVSESDPVMQEEIFGPVLPILTVESLEEAINFINRREKPLALYLYTGDSKHAPHLLSPSCPSPHSPSPLLPPLSSPLSLSLSPGSSGVGRYHGRFSFDTFSHQRSCVLRGFRLEWANQLRYPPYSEQKLERLLQATQERKWSCTLL